MRLFAHGFPALSDSAQFLYRWRTSTGPRTSVQSSEWHLAEYLLAMGVMTAFHERTVLFNRCRRFCRCTVFL